MKPYTALERMIKLRMRIRAEHLSAEQNHRCAYCGFMMYIPSLRIGEHDLIGDHNAESRKMRLATRDHVEAQSLGGGSGWDNLVAACFWCNSHRGNVPADHAFEIISALVAAGEHPHQVYYETGRYPAMSGLKHPDPFPPEREFQPELTWVANVDPDGWSPFDDPQPVRKARHASKHARLQQAAE